MSVFFKKAFFIILFRLIKSNRVASNFLVSNLSALLFKMRQPLGTFFDLSISNLSTSDLKLVKIFYLAKSVVSRPAAFLMSGFMG